MAQGADHLYDALSSTPPASHPLCGWVTVSTTTGHLCARFLSTLEVYAKKKRHATTKHEHSSYIFLTFIAQIRPYQ